MRGQGGRKTPWTCLQLLYTLLRPVSAEHLPWPHSQVPNTPYRMQDLAGNRNHLHKEFSGNLIQAGGFSRACPSSRREAQYTEFQK